MTPDPNPPSTLGELLHRHREGDPSARDAILVHCQDRFKYLTRQMLRKFPAVQQWEETSDVFHNVLIRLVSALRDLTFDSSLDFIRLATHHIRMELIDLNKKCRTELLGGPVSSSLDPLAAVPGPAEDPYNLAQWGEVHSKIDELQPADRELIDLLYYQGLTQPESAALLGRPLRTLKRDWQRARFRLMGLLGNDSPF